MSGLSDLLFFCLYSYGLTFMLKDALIFNGVRDRLHGGLRLESSGESPEEFVRTRRENFFFELFTCSFCTGTWSGILLAAMYLAAVPLTDPYAVGQIVVKWSLASATVGFVGDLLTQFLEQNID